MSLQSVKESLKQSIGFSSLGGAGTLAVHALSIIVLARILSPHEFGLMAIIVVFTSIASIFIDMGMGSALVHFRESRQGHFSTTFWFNLLLGSILMIAMMLASNAIAEFFHETDLASVTSTMALILIINASSVVPMALLQKHQAFKKIAATELSSAIAGFCIACLLAVLGFGVWALVASALTIAVMRTLLSFHLSGWAPSFHFSRQEFRLLWGFSGYLFGASIFNHVITKVDSVLVGRLLGANTLGLYSYAHQLANIPTGLVQFAISRVLFSSYASYQDDIVKIKRTHFRAIRTIAFFTFPFLLFASVTSDLFIPWLLGEKWLEMAHIFSFMCLVFLLDSIGTMSGPLFLSRGKTKSLFWLNVCVRSDQVLAIIIGIQFGLEGLMWSLLIIRAINYYPVYYFVGKTIGFSVLEFSRNILPVFISSIVMAMAMALLKATGAFGVERDIVTMLAYFFIAVVVYLSVLAIIGKETLTDMSSLFVARQHKQGRSRP